MTCCEWDTKIENILVEMNNYMSALGEEGQRDQAEYVEELTDDVSELPLLINILSDGGILRHASEIEKGLFVIETWDDFKMN